MLFERRLNKGDRTRITISIDSKVKHELLRLSKVHKTSVTKLIEGLVRDYSRKYDLGQM